MTGRAHWQATEACPCGEVHESRQFYYVSAVDGSRKALAAGPYDTHAETLAAVNLVRDQACRIDGTAWFYGWGTCGSDERLPARWSPSQITASS